LTKSGGKGLRDDRLPVIIARGASELIVSLVWFSVFEPLGVSSQTSLRTLLCISR